MTAIKFTKFGANSQFGGFEPGQLMRCSEALAHHLVVELGVAVFLDAPKPAETKTPVKRGRKHAAQ